MPRGLHRLAIGHVETRKDVTAILPLRQLYAAVLEPVDGYTQIGRACGCGGTLDLEVLRQRAAELGVADGAVRHAAQIVNMHHQFDGPTSSAWVVPDVQAPVYLGTAK